MALSIAGILVTGSTALAVNTQTLNNSSSGTTGNANTVLLPDDSATGTPAAPQGVTAAVPSTGPTATATPRDNLTASPSSPSSSPSFEPDDDKGGLTDAVEPGDDKGGLRVTPEPGDDKGGSRAPEPGDDSGGHSGRGGGDD